MAELTANAVRHGRVPGQDLHLRLAAQAEDGRQRVEVSDTRAERRPALTALGPGPHSESESGRGRLLVAALAADCGVTGRRSGSGKTVWATLHPGGPSTE
ncbi:ATP-binding protein [Streptomyces cellulosae]